MIQIASDSAIVIPEEMIHYGVSKTALLAVSVARQGRRGHGVTVNSVIAGPTHTDGFEEFVYEMVDKSLSWTNAQRSSWRHAPQSLFHRFIEPEIRNMVTYLASPLSSRPPGRAARQRRLRRLDPALSWRFWSLGCADRNVVSRDIVDTYVSGHR